MGAMRRKRRRKLARAWAAFQDRHGVSDEVLRLARMLGDSPERLETMMAEAHDAPAPAPDDRLRELHRQWEERRARRKELRAGGARADRKGTTGKQGHDPEWAKAKRLCRLEQNDIRMAKELGLKPRTLIKNVPSPTEQWKAPVKYWIRDLHAKRTLARDRG